MFQGDLDRLDNRADRFGQAFGDFALADDQFLRNAVHQVAALDFHGLAFAVFGGAGGTDVFLDPRGGAFADQEVMVAADVGDDGFIHLVAADADGARIDDAAQRQHGHLGGAAADIDDHGARGFRHRQAGADRGGHGFFDQEDLAGPCTFRRFLDRAALDGGGAGGHADDHQRAREGAPVVNLADEVFDHFFGDFEIGDDAVAQRPNGADVTGGTAEHLLGFLTDGENLFLAFDFGDGDHRWLVQDDALALDVDQRVRGAQIDGHVRGENPEKSREH